MDTLTKIQSSLIAGKEIQGVRLKPLKEHKDYRGSFTEIFEQKEDTGIQPTQWSMVKSDTNVFRGMHLHKRHDEYFCIVQGTCLVGLKDIRPDSSTYFQSSLYQLTGDDLASLIFPKGILHGWYFFESSVHIQAVSESYCDYGDDDNWGCHWQDPELDIPWGIENPIISDRSRNFPGLKALINALGDW